MQAMLMILWKFYPYERTIVCFELGSLQRLWDCGSQDPAESLVLINFDHMQCPLPKIWTRNVYLDQELLGLILDPVGLIMPLWLKNYLNEAHLVPSTPVLQENLSDKHSL